MKRVGGIRSWLIRRRVALILSLLVGLLAALSWPPSGSDNYFKQALVSGERSGLDLLFSIRGPRHDRIDPRIAVVGFGRNDEIVLGKRWPLPRSQHAKLLDRLKADGASLVVFDALFSDATSEKEDRSLDEALKRAEKVVIAQRLDRDTVQRQKSVEAPYYSDTLGIDFEQTATPGIAEVPLDSDQVVRSFVPAILFQDEWLPSLAVAAWLRFKDLGTESLGFSRDGLTVDGKSIGIPIQETKDPVDGSPIVSYLVDFPAGIDAFPSRFSYGQVLHGEFEKGFFKGKVVFVGVTGYELARELDDAYRISSSSLSIDIGQQSESNRSADYMRIPGVFVQALYFNAISKGGFLRVAPPWCVALLAGSITWVALAVTRRYIGWKGLFLSLATIAIYFVGSLLLFEYAQVHLPFVAPLAFIAASVGSVSWFERSSLKRRWSGYVSPTVLEQILANESGQFAKRLYATALFGDIRGFTQFSDRRDPALVVELLNKHFDRMAEVVFQEGGTIDKFMGDGILVVFGAPMPLKDAEFRAVRAALRMQKLSTEPIEHEGETYQFPTGFGIATGDIVAGHVGGKKRYDFTVIGDVVNLASRLQGVTGQDDVIVSAATFQAIEEHVTAEALGALTLKGIAEPVEAYRVVSIAENRKLSGNI